MSDEPGTDPGTDTAAADLTGLGPAQPVVAPVTDRPRLTAQPVLAAEADLPSRLSMVIYVYHERARSGTAVTSSRSSRPLSSTEEPYRRSQPVGEDWVPLDLGWLAGRPIAVLFLRNDGVEPSPTVLPEEERASRAARVVEVGYDSTPAEDPAVAGGRRRTQWDPPRPRAVPVEPCWLVPPGEGLPVTPVDPSRVRVRSPMGPVRLTVFAVPA